MISAVLLHHDLHGEDFLHAAGLLLAGGDGAVLDDILIVDDPDVAVALVGADGHLRHDERRVRIADRHAHADEHSGIEDARSDFGLWVRKFGADLQGAGGGIELIVHEIHFGGVGVIVHVGLQRHADGEALTFADCF